MKNKIFVTALTSLAAVACMQTASADQGVITFTGKITDNTCVVNSGSKDFTVTLPTLSAKSFSAKGDIAGRTAFKISLSDCATKTGGVHTYFEPGSTIDTATGNLNTDSGGATGLQIVLQNQDGTTINLAGADGSQNSKNVQLTDGAATMNYIAAYYATGTSVTAGPVSSSVIYSIVYE